MEWVVNPTPRPLYPGKEPVPIVDEVGWALGPVWPGAENLASRDSISGPSSLWRVAVPTELIPPIITVTIKIKTKFKIF
jgi:hypothetical protein